MGPQLRYRQADWSDPNKTLTRFKFFYEREHTHRPEVSLLSPVASYHMRRSDVKHITVSRQTWTLCERGRILLKSQSKFGGRRIFVQNLIWVEIKCVELKLIFKVMRCACLTRTGFCSDKIYYHITTKISVVRASFSIWVTVPPCAAHSERRRSTHWLRAIFNLLHFNITHSPYEPPSRVMREADCSLRCLDSRFSHTHTQGRRF